MKPSRVECINAAALLGANLKERGANTDDLIAAFETAAQSESLTDTDRKQIGFGIGIEPFRWGFGYVSNGGENRWLHLGPIFIQWKWPIRRRG